MDRQRGIDVIDDDIDVRSSLAAVLRCHGLRNDTFASADAFLVLQKRAYDCIVSDFQMPGTSGLQLLRSLRAKGETLPSVMMTAYGDAKLCAEVAANGAVLVEEPLNADRLVARLLGLLSDDGAQSAAPPPPGGGSGPGKSGSATST